MSVQNLQLNTHSVDFVQRYAKSHADFIEKTLNEKCPDKEITTDFQLTDLGCVVRFYYRLRTSTSPFVINFFFSCVSVKCVNFMKSYMSKVEGAWVRHQKK